ncbi:MAG: VWA domain-containing protein [Chlamydiota bacterium]|nr:VWA domain-containing protein [Chlamydiota bacterium]
MSFQSRIVIFLACVLLLTLSQSKAEDSPQNLEFIYDASNSMNEKMGDEKKIDVSKRVFINLLENMKSEGLLDINIGLRIYGSRFNPRGTKDEACRDSYMAVPIRGFDVENLKEVVQGIEAKGYTPIAYSLEQTPSDLAGVTGEKTVVLISDGQETCGGDPCAVAKKLKEEGLVLKMHVIGFDVTDKDRQQLECIANVTGGKYFSAENADALSNALMAVKEEVVVKKNTASQRVRIGGPGKIHFEKANWLSQDIPYYYKVLKKNSEGEFDYVTKVGNLDDISMPAGTYQILMRECEHGCPEVNVTSDLVVASGQTSTVNLKTGIALIMPEWGPKSIYYFTLARPVPDRPDDYENIVKYGGSLRPVLAPAGTYHLIYRQKEHGFREVVLAKDIVIQEGQLTQVQIGSGVQLIPTQKDAQAPYQWNVENLDTGLPAILGGQNWDAHPLMPGRYKLSVRATQHGHTLVELIPEIEIQEGQLVEVEI